MDTIKLNANGTMMIAHRGLSGLEKENTSPAFVAAANRSYFGIESDVRTTADGRFVMIHDDSTSRITAGETKLNVGQSDLNTLCQVLLPDVDGERFRGDIRIPNLQDYVSICKKYGKRCVLELKEHFSREGLERLISEISMLEYLHSVTFISFVYENCLLVRELLPEADVQLLTDADITDELVERLESGHFGLDIYYKRLTKEKVDLLHSKGIAVNCFTCDDLYDARRLVQMGVDYITTNILE